MAIPFFAATLGGMLIRSLQFFFVFKFVQVLAAFGLSIGTYIGLDAFVSYAASSIGAALSSVQGVQAFGHTIDAVGMINATGIVDAINIILSCHITALTIKSSKVALFGISK